MSAVLAADVVGTAAGLCSMASFTPQICKIVRDRDASAVSLRMYLITVTGFVLWTVYGLLRGSWPVWASNSVNLVLAGTILALKWRLDAVASGGAGLTQPPTTAKPPDPQDQVSAG
jgi:MtN3 and saliva related transmembrane protein